MSEMQRRSRISEMPPKLKFSKPDAVLERKHKVIMGSHMDPRLSNGGAEIAAFQLYNELVKSGAIEGWFLSAAPNKLERRDGVVFAQPFDERSYVYAGGEFNHFLHANMDLDFFEHARQLISDIDPDIVHLHHYTNFGVELIAIIKEVSPRTKIVLTLHEFLAICNHYGQMVKRPSFSLCEKSSPRDCAKCFPEYSPQDFFLRKAYLFRYFEQVDHFISPSEFLADRYVQWGIPRQKISVIENGSPHTGPGQDHQEAKVDGPLRIGFFGQISRLKGIDVILGAAEALAEAEVDICFEIHGDYSSQPPPFQTEFFDRLRTAPKNFRYFGPYDNGNISRIMASVDAVIVPSIWWENSPLVIQEALSRNRPVICSDIGGMKEKVRPGLDGFHFQACSEAALVELLTTICENRTILSSLSTSIKKPPLIDQTARSTLEIFKQLLN